MRRISVTIILFFIVWKINIGQVNSKASIPVMNFKQFEPYLHLHSDTTYLINFWATWCVPCREELPAIEAVGKKYAHQKFRIILVSLDFRNQLKSRLMPFIKSHDISSEVILLDDPDQNSWIDKVDPGWSGEIPFTVIYGKDFRQSYAKSFRFKELDSIINHKINSL